MTLLALHRVCLERGGRRLASDLTLALEAGDALNLEGPNGAGKSSLLRLMAGLLPPASGRVERSAAALADEGLALDPELELERALRFWGGPQLDAAIAAYGLEPLRQVPVRILSNGQARRARLARVMASGAPLWLLDEPLNGLDETGKACLRAALDRHRAAGGAVVAASHGALPGTWRRLAL